ncbi:MAG: DNA-protecting protein DprA [FCB group bacterium]|nr:DNA-protecting protein DprA [FCB group bacterium]
MNSLEQLLNLLNVPGLGPHRIRSLISAYSLETTIFNLSVQQLCLVPGIDMKLARHIKEYSKFDYGRRELDNARKLDTTIVSFYDNGYPLLLRKIYNPPVLLYVRGNRVPPRGDCVAVVGTRSMTRYGKEVTTGLVKDLTSLGLTIVSGLARGIDTVAHNTCVAAGGRTLAVLGTGVDRIYPAENKKLAQGIMEQGAMISEYPLGTKPDATNFPRRNRIISGLSLGTIIIEAGTKSGAILTALNAVDQNREVFAVPGRITDKQSVGCNRLIRNGAVPVTKVDDILENIEKQLNKPVRPMQQNLELDLNREERFILEKLSHDPIQIDALAEETGIDVIQLLSKLLELELKGAVVQISGKQFLKSGQVFIQ